MEYTIFTVWTLLLILCISFALLLQYERRRGQRLGVTKLRTALDRPVGQVEIALVRSWQHFTRYIVKLHWHYWIHWCYRSVLLVLQGVYQRLETRFERNRHAAKQLRAEKRLVDNSSGHLGEVAAHKAAHALTPAQKRALKKKSVESY